LKALDPDVHVALTGRTNARVLASLRQLTELGRLAEVRLLIVPGVNDEPAQLAATAQWLTELDPIPPVVVQGYRREGTRQVARSFRTATSSDLTAVASTLITYGLPALRVSVRSARSAAMQLHPT
jgi:pyruvate-formate lyase-activating enzyme